MASFFESLFVGGWALLSSTHGETMTYAPGGSGGATVTGIHLPDQTDPVFESDGRLTTSRRRVLLQASDAATPLATDTFAIGGVTYSVDAQAPGGGIVKSAAGVEFALRRTS